MTQPHDRIYTSSRDVTKPGHLAWVELSLGPWSCNEVAGGPELRFHNI